MLQKYEQDNYGYQAAPLPDRWGQFLLNRQEQIIAAEENRPVRHAFRSNFVLKGL